MMFTLRGELPMGPNMSRITAIVALGLAVAPWVNAQQNCIHPRMISVTGTSEIKVIPDEAILILGAESHDKDLAVAKANNDKSINKLLSLAHSVGIDAKGIQTSALSMGPEYSEEKIPKLLGYQVSQTITLILKDLSKYEELLTGALKAGINRVNGINFTVSDTKKYKEDARLKAVRAAREKATAIAGELGQTIGKPWEVTEEAEYDATANLASNMSPFIAGLPEERIPGAPVIAGGEVTIRSSVRVSFQLE
jgi:uncharacterized protein